MGGARVSHSAPLCCCGAPAEEQAGRYRRRHASIDGPHQSNPQNPQPLSLPAGPLGGAVHPSNKVVKLWQGAGTKDDISLLAPAHCRAGQAGVPVRPGLPGRLCLAAHVVRFPSPSSALLACLSYRTCAMRQPLARQHSDCGRGGGV